MNEKYPKILLDQFKQLDSQMRIYFIHDCLYEVNCVDIPNASEAFGIDRRTVYQRIKSGKLNAINICSHKFPCLYK